MVFAALAAGIARLAKAAPLARTEFSRALIGQQRFGPHLCFCPENELLCRDLVGRSVGQPGLHDGHAHGVNVVQRIELQQRTEAVQHQLAVLACIHPDTPAALEVDHLDDPIRDDHQITRAESIRHILAVVQPVLHHDQRIRAGQPDRFDGFNAEGDVFIRDAFGLVRVEVVVPVFGVLLLDEIRGHIPQIPVQLQLAQLVQEGSLFRIRRWFVCKLFRELHRWRAHHPAMGAGCVQSGVRTAAVLHSLYFWHAFCTSAMTALY